MERGKRVIRLGTRKSPLAMIQTMLVSDALKKADRGLQVEIVPMVTKGDKILNKSLVEFGGKGAFVTEFENALLDGRIDGAVHSAKDMPAKLAEGLEILAVLPREDPGDVFVTVKGRKLPDGPIVTGTGSLRRQIQICERKNAVCKLVRGNVNTRLEKLWSGEYDALVLAAAGLKRMGLFEDERFVFERLCEKEFIPAGGQAIIAVEGRKDSEFFDLFQQINHTLTMTELKTERQVLELLGVGCNAAIGVYSFVEEGRFCVTGMNAAEMNVTGMNVTGINVAGINSAEGCIVRRTVSGAPENWRRLAENLAKELNHG